MDAREGRPVRRLATWARRILIAEDGRHETVAARARSAGARRHSQPEARPAALHAAAQRRRRHLDDLMVTRPLDAERRRRGLMLVVNAARKDADFAHIAARLPKGVRLASRPDRALLALQGPAAGGVLASLAPDGCRPRLHDGAGHDASAASTVHVSRSGYTGEDGFEISVAAERPRSLRRAAAGRRTASSRSASAPATRCASKPASASTATTSTRRPRRSRPGSPGRSRSAGARGRLPRRRAHPARAGGRPAAPARRHQPDGRAPAREGTEILSTRRRQDRHRHLRRLRPDRQRPDRHGLRRRPPTPSPARRCSSSCAASRCRPRVVPLPFVPHRYHGRQTLRESELTMERLEVPMATRNGEQYTSRKDHEWIRVEGDVGTVGITDYAQGSSATSSSSRCPRSAAR